ncbi:SMI1/KNR4 family protein [Pseudanabaena sp. UWO311]|uniref:SMI1/KNR4 family protein n=1 Tax=Pseudanabaena sp. UWO311 TaxID=2487337 RepID=UPI0011580921|nr:SMI1/KNR4 family protein [Pseudanabaena sp. UWO311]TYQ29089.1 SMI1/KNR4 family protein [Pseudanabaena sp. UWO311]
MGIQQLLEEIYTIVSEIMPETANSLQTGLSRDAIKAIIEPLPFDLPEDFYKLYEWRNGSNTFEDNFFPYHTFLPLENSVNSYFELREGEFAKWINWPPNWFPFLKFDAKLYLFLDVERNTIREYFAELGTKSTRLMFDNLRDMLSYY